jgi:lysozyme family protein
MADFNKAIETILRHEGGYVNNTNDPGGETNFGICKRSFPDLDIKNLTVEQAKDIYREKYWNPIKGGMLKDLDVAISIFDFAVNAGIGVAIKVAQKVTGATQDSIMGNQTISLINGFDPEYFQALYTVAKIALYINIVKKRPSSKEFFFGWCRRALNDF